VRSTKSAGLERGFPRESPAMLVQAGCRTRIKQQGLAGARPPLRKCGHRLAGGLLQLHFDRDWALLLNGILRGTPQPSHAWSHALASLSAPASLAPLFFGLCWLFWPKALAGVLAESGPSSLGRNFPLPLPGITPGPNHQHLAPIKHGPSRLADVPESSQQTAARRRLVGGVLQGAASYGASRRTVAPGPLPLALLVPSWGLQLPGPGPRRPWRLLKGTNGAPRKQERSVLPDPMSSGSPLRYPPGRSPAVSYRLESHGT